MNPQDITQAPLAAAAPVTVAATESFRAEFRQAVPADYNGIRHGLTILGIGLLGIAAALACLRAPVQAWEWAVALPVVLIWNWLEWLGHRALHTPGRGALARALYTRHTLTHHRFFTRQAGALRDSRDLKIVFFPWFAILVLAAMALPAVLLIGLLVSVNAAAVAFAAWVGIYLVFEFMHLCAHLPEGAWLARVPGIAAMRRHHLAHHDPRLMMQANMNFTLPLADWLAGTRQP
ncbi:MAG: sterol desaturase family protein [Betaproteobacteria bacterium]|nr:sterol desaturase family protein [Betaproteobacteria bacterium]